VVRLYIPVGYPGYIFSPRAVDINSVPPVVCIPFIHIMHSWQYGNISVPGYIMPTDISVAHIAFVYKAPAPVVRVPLTSQRHIDGYSIAKGSPSVISGAIIPFNPCRPPCIVGYPEPPEIVLVFPPPIMERRPAPVKIGNPCPTLIGTCPVPV